MSRSDARMQLKCALGTAILLLAVAGCDRPESDDAGDTAAREPTLVKVTRSSRVSEPTPADPAAFSASLRRHYPPALRGSGRGGDVLVDVRLDDAGRVLDVDVVEERKTVGNEHRVVALEEVPGSDRQVQREVQLNYDPEAFGAAAEAAVREVRFRPALRDGKAVPYTLRMTVTFTAPDAR